MADLAGTVTGWAIPALVVFGATALITGVIVWAVYRSRRSPAARAAADRERAAAGSALLRLDDAVEELDIEIGLSGALYGGGGSDTLRRARMTAQHARDRAFADYRALVETAHVPAHVRRESERLRSRVDDALRGIGRARDEVAAWSALNSSAPERVAMIAERLAAVRASTGDPAALLRELRERFAEPEWADAERAATEVRTCLADADARLAAADVASSDPARSALADLAAAERALRGAEAAARLLEESHRLVVQAAHNAPAEVASFRDDLRTANALREHLGPPDAARLGTELREIAARLDEVEPTLSRTPTAAIAAIARLHTRYDAALGDARTAQQRLRGARSALPGTLAAARAAVAHAESYGVEESADARVRLAGAQRELARARSANDPVEALDGARRAIRMAEDAVALADYARTASRPGPGGALS